MNSEYKPTKENMYFMCYFMEMFSREMMLSKIEIAEKMAEEYVQNILEYEDVYHSLSPSQLIYEQKEILGLKKGRLNRIATADFKVPSVDDMAYLYTRLVNKIGGYTPQSFLKVMSSPVTKHIDDYNGSLYYENEDYIVDCIKEGKIIIL